MSCSYAVIDGDQPIALGHCIKFQDDEFIKAECSGTQGSVMMYTAAGCLGDGMTVNPTGVGDEMTATVENCPNAPCDYFLERMDDEDDQGNEVSCTQSSNWIKMPLGGCMEFEDDETNPPSIMSIKVTECTEAEGVKVSVWFGAGQDCSRVPADMTMNEEEFGEPECIKCAPPPTTPAPQAASAANVDASSASVKGWLSVGLVAALIAAVATV